MKSMVACVMALLVPLPLLAAELSVTLANVREGRGTVHVSLCTEKEFLEKCALRLKQAAASGAMVFVFKNVPPGKYAVQVHHDANDNGKMDRGGFLGLMPREAYGFSRLGRLFSTPKFAQAGLDITGPAQSITINLVYP